ncbi:MAG: phytoene/squalene synthase family protein [Solirubrobacterales bacterium]|nr:phytoene/squalene synthase family protein [Solirubrobacterales bacterium]
MDDLTPRDEAVHAAYGRCRRLQRRHDPTFFLATARLPRNRRPAVHALYGFLRGADEIVDGRHRASHPAARRAALDGWQAALHDGLTGARPAHPVLAALAHAGPRHDLPLHLLDRYMDSMRIDCEDRVRIGDPQALDRYMDGSAATVGRLMAPLLDAGESAVEPLAQLGVAFQLTNFIRDVREDWELDRVYLPGLDEETLRLGVVTPAFRERIGAEVRRARELFAQTATVQTEVPPSVRPGIRLARSVYERVLDRVEALDGDVLSRRTGVGAWGIARAAVDTVRTA